MLNAITTGKIRIYVVKRYRQMNVQDSLNAFNLTPVEQEIFLGLAKSGWNTVLSLSRISGIKRTTLYHLLESLVQRGFVEMKIGDKTSYYRSASLESLTLIIARQKEKTQKMQEAMSLLTTSLNLLTPNNELSTDVKFYHSQRGIETVEWKMSQDKNAETFVFATNQWSKQVEEKFAEEVRTERLLNNVKIKELANPGHYGKIPNNGVVSWTKNTEYLKKIYRHRLLSESVLPITNEVIIHSNSLFLYSLENSDIVTIEVKNAGYTTLMRHLFLAMWNQAKTMDNFG